jgi:multicomponent Na+:H+ antiporter subunit D
LLIPFAGVVAALLTRKQAKLVKGLVALGVMLVALGFVSWLTWVVFSSPVPLVLQPGLWPVPIGITLIADPLSTFLLLMSHLVLTAGVLYALGSTEKAVQYPAFYPLFLGLATGLSGVFLTGDLLNFFVFAEVVVITGAALTGLADDHYGVEAAYKYILISTVASTFFLIGIGSLYAAYDTLNIAQLAELISLNAPSPLALAGMAFLAATFLTKSAVFPFHFWQPDFHAAAPTPVSAMLSSIVVKVGVYGLLRLTSLIFVAQAAGLQTLLVILGVVGVIYGGFGAAGTHNAKRMLAYSTLSQIGFVLIGLGWGTPLSIAAALVFAFNHALAKSAMLMLAGAIASRAAVKSASFEVVLGVGKNSPAAGLLFLLGGMALAGIPPTNGFLSKLGIFSSGVAAGQYLPLALAGVASVLTLFYIISAFIKIWFEPRSDLKPKKGDLLLAPALLIFLCVVLGLWAEPLIAASQQIATSLANPALYIQAVTILE